MSFEQKKEKEKKGYGPVDPKTSLYIVEEK